ncbi:tol-pal system protein YbgF [Thalassospira australica]|uniref:tol-pal system protein YbgF n=1 Tax=Thalassospira australica TaxID=1528106 RepID=UPI00384A8794
MIRVGPKTGYRNDAPPPRMSAVALSPTVGGKQGVLRRRPVGYLSVFAVAALMGMTVLGSASALAQESNMTRQVEQLRKDLDLLQRYVYREGVPSGGVPDSGGASDGSPAAARQQVQINEIERSITQLTGQIEEFDFRIRKIEDRLERLVSDVDFRLSQLEGGAPSASGQTGAAPSAAAGEGAAASATASNDRPNTEGTGQRVDDRGTQLFGVIENEGSPPAVPSGPANTSSSAPARTASAPAGGGVLPDGTPEEQYRYAFDLLRRQDFSAAETALAAFVKNHPDNALAGNAQYWLGETFYVREQYDQAAVAFTEGFQTYPDSSKAADNLLKLGMSLGNLGKNEDACTTFGHLISNFPNASAVVLDRARQESKNRGCS